MVAARFCSNCGNEFSKVARFCAMCGATRANIDQVAPISTPGPTPSVLREAQVATQPTSTSEGQWYRQPLPAAAIGVFAFMSSYAITTLPADRIRMPIILAPLYYTMGHEAFFGGVSALIGVIIWLWLRWGE